MKKLIAIAAVVLLAACQTKLSDKEIFLHTVEVFNVGVEAATDLANSDQLTLKQAEKIDPIIQAGNKCVQKGRVAFLGSTSDAQRRLRLAIDCIDGAHAEITALIGG
jgi:predicted ATP-dependent Lon-type protease